MIKFYKIIVFILVSISSSGQSNSDSLLSKNSWSFTAGTNIIYSLVNEYKDKDELGNYDFTISPQTSYSPWIILNYSRIFYDNDKSSFCLLLGAGYTQNRYIASATGWYSLDFPPYINNGTFKWFNKINIVNLNLGISSNIKFEKDRAWYNQLFISADYFNRNTGFSFF